MQGYPPRLLALCERCPQSMLNREYWSIKDFVLVKEVGSGAASTVYYAICRKSTQPVAIKMYLKSKLSKLNRRQVEREINIHSSLSHPHIIDFYAAFEDDDRIYLVQEYAAGGDLFDDVKRRGGRLPEREVVQHILHPYLTALSYLHARGIIHRDIKPENTVFTRERVLKVTDFGLAISACSERPVTRLGTLDYMAPEVLRCPDKHSPDDNKDRVDLEYDMSVDAWAMGVLAYELIVGRPPFGMSCREATMRAIVAASPSIPDWMSPAAADFIRSALQRTPARRLPVDELLQHPWITGHVGPASAGAAAAAAVARSFHTAQQPARNLSCGAEAAAMAAAAAALVGASTSTAAAVASAAAGDGPVKSFLCHPAAPYKHLMAQPQGCTSASASELGGGVAAATLVYGSDQRPAKRQVHRCQSAFLDGPGGDGTGGGCTTAAALTPPGLMAQHGAPLQRLYDNCSYWMTDGNGFRPDPLFGLDGGSGAQKAATAASQQQRQQHQTVMAAAMAAAAASGAASPIGSPMAIGRAQDFYRSQLAQPGGGGAGTAGVYGASPLQVDALTLQQQQLQLQGGEQPHTFQQYQQQLHYHTQQQQQQHQEEVQRQQMEIFMQQQLAERQHQQQLQQHVFAMEVESQQLQQLLQHQQQDLQQRRQDGDSVSGSGESTGGVAAVGAAAAVEPSVPSLTAADYYKLRLGDLRSMWEVGGRSPGNGCRAASGPRGLSRSFTARHAGRTASSAGGSGTPAGPAPAAAAAAAAAVVAQSTAAARLLRNGSSSSGGSMKRRTPDTHDWDLPLLPTALSVQQMQLQYMTVARPAATTNGFRPASPLGRSSDTFAAGGGAMAFFTNLGGSAGAPAAAAPVAATAVGCPVTPFSPYAAMSAAAGPDAAQLATSLSLTSYGSAGGQRPSRLSKAFRRVDSMEPMEGAVGFGAVLAGQGSDGSGCGGGSGSGATRAGLPQARCSGATAAMAALDQLTLAPGPGTVAAAAAAVAAVAAAAANGGATADSVIAAAMQAAKYRAGSGGDADAAGLSRGGSAGDGSNMTPSDSSNGSSAAACTAMTGTSCGGTSGSGSGPFSASACSYGYSAASGCSGSVTAAAAAPNGSPHHRAPSITTCGVAFPSPGQNIAALRLSLPTLLPRLGIPPAGSTTGGGGGVGLRSHPLSSPQVTPWSTPLSSPAAGAGRMMARMHSQPPGASSFNALLDLMEAEGVLTSAEATADCGTAAVAAAAAAAFGGGSSRSGSLDAPDWAAAAAVAAAAAGAASDAAADGLTAPMQVDDMLGGVAAGGDAMPYYNRSASATEQELLAAGTVGATAVATAPQAAQHMSPEDRWAAAWAAAAASSGSNAGRTTPTAPTTPPPMGRAGSFGLPGTSCPSAAAGNAMHAPSPLGRDQPHQQARAAAMQQHIRSRSLNRFQLEQLGLSTMSGSFGGGAAPAPGSVPSPFGVSPPISPRGANSDAAAAMTGADAIATASSFTGGSAFGGGGGNVFAGGSSGGAGGGGAFGNRHAGQQLPQSSSLRGPLPYNSTAVQFSMMGGSLRSHQHYGMGVVQCGGGGVMSPSPLGLRSSRSRASNTSSEDTSSLSERSSVAAPAPPAGCSGGGACEGTRPR